MIFKPECYIQSYKHIDINKLKEKNYQLIIVDIDNTLIPCDSKIVSKDAIDFVNKLKEDFIVVVASNNVRKRVKPLADKLTLPFYSFALKPLPFTFYHISKKYHGDRKKILLIGDQIMTDVLASKTSNISCILVDPIVDKDNIFGTITRSIENIIRKLFDFNRGDYYDKM